MVEQLYLKRLRRLREDSGGRSLEVSVLRKERVKITKGRGCLESGRRHFLMRSFLRNLEESTS